MSTPSTPAHRVPLRDLPRPRAGGEESQLKYLAIDLGTWSSTATLYESNQTHYVVLDPKHEVALRAGLSELLAGPVLRADQEELVRAVNDWLAGQPLGQRIAPADGVDGVRRALNRAGRRWNGVPDEEYNELRRAVCMAIDRRMTADPALAEALAWPVHRLYDEVYSGPALRSHRLWPVGLRDQYRAAEIRSILAVNLGRVPDSRLVDVMVSDADAPPGVKYAIGIKRRLLRRERDDDLVVESLPTGWEPDTDLLVAQAYSDLIRRVGDAVANAPDPDSLLHGLLARKDSPIDEVTITYPTTLAPSVRLRLRDLVSDALGIDRSRVHMQYDEAVAAALYFVMRGFGGDLEAGLRSFRAAARQVPGTAQPTWRQNVIVIDIGGGTTDIAVVALELVEDTRTQPGYQEPTNAVYGRHYTLRPRVLGTTGHPQLGGDLLTLRIFYWLKATVLDALRSAEGTNAAGSEDEDPRGLAEQLIAFGLADPVPPELGRVLREGLPSHCDQPNVRTAVFDRLWDAAETAKIDYLARGESYRLESTWAEGLPDDCAWRDRVRALPQDAVVLRAEDFGRLLEPVLRVAVGLAADVVRRTVGMEPDGRLDIVALSGRTTGIPQVRVLVRDQLAEHLVRHDQGVGPVPWNPHAIIVEEQHAKQAASLGACWARAVRELGVTDGDRLAAGLDQLEINVNNLLVSLPSDFGLQGTYDKPRPWLRRGQPMQMAVSRGPMAQAAGNLFACTQWRRMLSDDLHLHRILGPDLSLQWGSFQYSRFSGTDQLPTGLWYRLAVDQDQTAWISLCRGTTEAVRPLFQPATGTDQDSRDFLDLSRFPALDDLFDGTLLHTVPTIEVVAVDPEGPAPDAVHRTVFREGAAEERLTVDFVDEGTPIGTPDRFGTLPGQSMHRGAISATALPPTLLGRLCPARFEFRAVLPGRAAIPLGAIRPPLFRDQDRNELPHAPFWALLDERGHLRVNAGYPDFLDAGTLALMQDQPGWVYTRALRDSIPDWIPGWDPFTGKH